MISKFFIDRPVFATVISVVIVIVGGVALFVLPIAQYPDVVPPTIQVTAVYPGANAQTVSETVATPIEQEVNGVERMLYMSSKCTNDGVMALDITFEVGTDLDTAQVLVQNRVAIAQPKLPEEVRRQGISTKKRSPNILLVVSMVSPDLSRDSLYISNFATLQVKDTLARVKGVGDVMVFGARDYSMRVWLDPEQLASRNMNAGDVIKALSEQNVQVAAGRIGQPPTTSTAQFQLSVSTQGRLLDEHEFGRVIVKTGADGQVVRLDEVARIELGARSYDSSNDLDGKPSVGLVAFQQPGSNALQTAQAIRATMEKLKKDFPVGLDYEIVYDTTVFVDESIAAVYHTLIEAFLLVFVVVLLFLQDWKATILPMIDVPVSLIGTFAIMGVMGFSLNNLTLFGLVLAIGIVVDDAIVVLENVERWLAKGYNAREATIKAMEEVTGPIIAITLVLSSVFIPTAFIPGITGQFYRQFALTIAASTVISAINAMTMTPSRAVQIFERAAHHTDHHDSKEALPWWGVGAAFGIVLVWFFYDWVQPWLGLPVVGHGSHIEHVAHHQAWGLEAWLIRFGVSEAWLPRAGQLTLFTMAWIAGTIVNWPVRLFLKGFLWLFNKGFETVEHLYGATVKWVVRLSVVMLILYGGLMVLTNVGFNRVPTGFIPEQDKGYLIIFAQLPDGASLDRTEKVMTEIGNIAIETPGVGHTINVPGFSLLNGSNISNAGTMFLSLKPFAERSRDRAQYATAIQQAITGRLAGIQDATIMVLNAPPVDGLGNSSGFKLQVQDKTGQGLEALNGALDNYMAAAMAQKRFITFSTFRINEPQLYLEIDRTKAKSAGVQLSDVFQSLSGYLGTSYVNDFTRFSRNWQVNVQADTSFRATSDDIRRLKVRNSTGDMVPLGSILTVKDVVGPAVVSRYNMFPAADINGALFPGTTTGEALAMMDHLANTELPQGIGYEWTDLSLQQQMTGNNAVFVFVLGTVFVYLVLAAQYESWTMPLAVVLIVPMCLFSAVGGLWLIGGDNNVFTQIGLVVLIGLASKNAILIVEFARQLQSEGRTAFQAVVEACRLRLRPIIMTSLAFILGVVPLVFAQGAGAEMRRAIGTAVFWGMLGVTLFGLFFTPVFYFCIQWVLGKTAPTSPASLEGAGHADVNGEAVIAAEVPTPSTIRWQDRFSQISAAIAKMFAPKR